MFLRFCSCLKISAHFSISGRKFWGFPLFAMLGDPALQADAQFPPAWMFAAVIPLSLLGTWMGGKVLERMTDANFRTWTKWIVTATGVVYLARGLWLG